MLVPFKTSPVKLTQQLLFPSNIFAEHKKMASKLNATLYFAHPYSSWERGLNENTSSLIRQYFLKGSDFTNITQRDTNRAMNKLNTDQENVIVLKRLIKYF